MDQNPTPEFPTKQLFRRNVKPVGTVALRIQNAFISWKCCLYDDPYSKEEILTYQTLIFALEEAIRIAKAFRRTVRGKDT